MLFVMVVVLARLANGAPTDEENEYNRLIMEKNDCHCVPNYNCDEDGFIVTNGRGLLNERLGERVNLVCKGGKYEGELFCCKLPGQNVTSTTGSATENLLCGASRSSMNPAKSGAGADLIDGEFPWLAIIYERNKVNGKWTYYRMGSLIHPKVILTAAHVVIRSKPNNFKVIVDGKTQLRQIGDNENQERNVQEIIKHPNYSSGTLRYDIALLILEEAYDMKTSAANVICLRPELPCENKRCFVAGWNKSSGQNSSALNKFNIPVLSDDECRAKLRNIVPNPNFQFHNSFMCAGGEEGKDVCEGDGGSPLVCESTVSNNMYQVGIAIFGIGCGRKGVPGLYANVGHLNGWIMDNLANINI